MSQIQTSLVHLIEKYLDGHLRLHEFEDEFVPVLWGLDDSAEIDSKELAGEIHISLAEYSRGDSSLHGFRQKLAELVKRAGAAGESRIFAFSIRRAGPVIRATLIPGPGLRSIPDEPEVSFHASTKSQARPYTIDALRA